jgi:DNA-binding Xre family transcriptional regulator
MQNNLKKLIQKAGLNQIEFGQLVWPEKECKTEKEQNTMQVTVSKYCSMNLKSIKLDLMHKFCVILKCSYNELWDYEP